MASQTGYDYWHLRLPAGPKQRGKEETEQITEELTELAERGWEPVSMAMPSIMSTFFLLRKRSA